MKEIKPPKLPPGYYRRALLKYRMNLKRILNKHGAPKGAQLPERRRIKQKEAK